AAKLPSVHHRHLEVENDESGQWLAAQIFERLLAVGAERDPITFEIEDVAQRGTRPFVVLDDEQFGGRECFCVCHFAAFREDAGKRRGRTIWLGRMLPMLGAVA